MKETPLSNCERDFLLKAIQEKKVNIASSFWNHMNPTKHCQCFCTFTEMNQVQVLHFADKTPTVLLYRVCGVMVTCSDAFLPAAPGWTADL